MRLDLPKINELPNEAIHSAITDEMQDWLTVNVGPIIFADSECSFHTHYFPNTISLKNLINLIDTLPSEYFDGLTEKVFRANQMIIGVGWQLHYRYERIFHAHGTFVQERFISFDHYADAMAFKLAFL
jgi:hypothetical protein